MPNPYSPIGTNAGYIPTAAGNEDLVTAFSRNIGSFAIPQYCPMKPVDRQQGYYAVFNPEPNFRLGTNPLGQAVWADGASRKLGVTNQTEMEFVEYLTIRKNKSTVITRLQAQQSDWPVEAENSAKIAQLMMTLRVYEAYAALTNAVWGNNTGPVAHGISGSIVDAVFSGASAGNWATGTPSQPNILGSLNYALRVISKQTGGAFNNDEFCLVVSPDVAAGMAISPEIQQTLEQSRFAGQLLTGDDSPDGVIAKWNEKFGMPTHIRGFPLIVDDTVADTTTNPGSNGTGAGSYVWGSDSAFLLRRPKNHLKNIVLPVDDQNSNRLAWSPVPATLVMITKEEFTAEAFEDPEDRITRAHIASDYVMRVTSPLSGFYFTNVFS